MSINRLRCLYTSLAGSNETIREFEKNTGKQIAPEQSVMTVQEFFVH